MNNCNYYSILSQVHRNFNGNLIILALLIEFYYVFCLQSLNKILYYMKRIPWKSIVILKLQKCLSTYYSHFIKTSNQKPTIFHRKNFPRKKASQNQFSNSPETSSHKIVRFLTQSASFTNTQI